MFVVIKERFNVRRRRFQTIQEPLRFWTNHGKLGNHLLCRGIVPRGFDGKEIVVKSTDGVFDLGKVNGKRAIGFTTKPPLSRR